MSRVFFFFFLVKSLWHISLMVYMVPTSPTRPDPHRHRTQAPYFGGLYYYFLILIFFVVLVYSILSNLFMIGEFYLCLIFSCTNHFLNYLFHSWGSQYLLCDWKQWLSLLGVLSEILCFFLVTSEATVSYSQNIMDDEYEKFIRRMNPPRYLLLISLIVTSILMQYIWFMAFTPTSFVFLSEL